MSEQESTLDEFVSDSVDSSSQKSEKKLRKLVEKDAAGVWGDEPNGDGVKVLRATNYGENTIDLSDVAVRDIPESKRTSKKLEPGDIIVERSGGSADQPVGRVLFFNLEGEYYHGNFLRQLRPKASEINSRYLYYYLDYDYKRGGTKPLQTNTTNIRNLQYSSYLNQNIPVKPLSEQRKIATVLYTVDQAIEKTEEIIEQFRTIKNGTIHQFLSGGITHAEYRGARIGPKKVRIPSEWAIKRISEIADIKNGNRIIPGHEYADGRTEFPFIRISDMEDGTVSTEDIKYLKKETASQMNRGIIGSNDVFITVTGRVGDAGIVPEELDGARFTDNAAKLYNFEGVTNEYLSLYLRSKFGKDEVHRFTVGSNQPKLSMYRVEKMEVLVPSIEEQKQIVEKISSIQECIKSNEKVERWLRSIKQGLMQDLLSGTVRTTDTNITVPDEVAQHG